MLIKGVDFEHGITYFSGIGSPGYKTDAEETIFSRGLFPFRGYATFAERFMRLLMLHPGFLDLSAKDQVNVF